MVLPEQAAVSSREISSQPGSQKDAELKVSGAGDAGGIFFLASWVIRGRCSAAPTSSPNRLMHLFFLELIRHSS